MFKALTLWFLVFISISGFAQENKLSDKKKAVIDKLFASETEWSTCASVITKMHATFAGKTLTGKAEERRKIVGKNGDRIFLDKVKIVTKGVNTDEYGVDQDVYMYSLDKLVALTDKVLAAQLQDWKKNPESFKTKIKDLSENETKAFLLHDAYMKNNCQKFNR